MSSVFLMTLNGFCLSLVKLPGSLLDMILISFEVTRGSHLFFYFCYNYSFIFIYFYHLEPLAPCELIITDKNKNKIKTESYRNGSLLSGEMKVVLDA